MSAIHYLSLCSGIEAATMAWHDLGWKPVAFAEIEPFPAAALTHHYPDVPNLGDMTRWREWPEDMLQQVDVLVGGTPCQAFSVAGLRNSLADERGNLTLIYAHILQAIDDARARAGRHPAVCLWENVPGVLNTNDNALGCFLAALAGEDVPLLPPGGRWTNAGYVRGPDRAICWRVLDAQYFGVAQRRRRVFLVAGAGKGFRPEQVLFEQDGLRRDSAPSREAGKGSTPSVAACLGGSGQSGGFRTTDLDGTGAFIPEVAGCLQERDSKGADSDTKPGHLIPVAFSNKGHFGNLFETETSDPLRAKGGDTGNGGETIVTHTLRGEGFDASEDGTGRGTPIVPVAFSCKDHGADAGDIAPTLRSMNHDGSHANGGGQVAVAFEPRMVRTTGGQPQAELTHCLRSDANTGDGAPCVAFAQNSRDELREMPYVGALSAEPGMKQTSYIRSSMQVRRLTPTECERLQGFPDHFTAIPWRGKSADQCPDGPRYKALGNSMAVPCMAFIDRRLNACLNSPITPTTP